MGFRAIPPRKAIFFPPDPSLAFINVWRCAQPIFKTLRSSISAGEDAAMSNVC